MKEAEPDCVPDWFSSTRLIFLQPFSETFRLLNACSSASHYLLFPFLPTRAFTAVGLDRVIITLPPIYLLPINFYRLGGDLRPNHCPQFSILASGFIPNRLGKGGALPHTPFFFLLIFSPFFHFYLLFHSVFLYSFYFIFMAIFCKYSLSS